MARIRTARAHRSVAATAAALVACTAGVAAGQEERETRKAPLHGKHWVAITGKPLAATAGALTFARGGNAVDAACAMLAAAATMWDTLSLGWRDASADLRSSQRQGARDQRARRRADRCDARVLPLARPARAARLRAARRSDAGHARRLARHARGVRHAEPRQVLEPAHADGGRLPDGADADREHRGAARS